MKKIFANDIFRDDVFQLGCIVSIIINIGIWFLLYRNIQPSSEPLVLQYNIYFGISYIGEWQRIFALPVIGLIIFLINYFLAYFIYIREKVAAYFLLISSVILQAILLWSAHLITTYI